MSGKKQSKKYVPQQYKLNKTIMSMKKKQALILNVMAFCTLLDKMEGIRKELMVKPDCDCYLIEQINKNIKNSKKTLNRLELELNNKHNYVLPNRN